MAKDEFDMFDDELDDLDFDALGEDEDSGSRKPVDRVKRVGTNLIDELKNTDKSDVGAVALKAFKEAGGAEASAVADTAANFGQMMKDTAKEMRSGISPLMNSLKQVSGDGIIGRTLNRIDQRFGITGSTSSSSLRTQSAEEREREEAARQTAAILGEARSADRNRELLIKATEHNMSKNQLNALNKLVGYQDQHLKFLNQTTSKYYRKSLENQYRLLFLTKRHLETNVKGLDLIHKQLDAISKNTALPEFVKIRSSEAIKAELRRKVTSSLLDSAVKDNKFLDALTNRGKDMSVRAKEMIAQMADLSQGGGDMAEMLKSIPPEQLAAMQLKDIMLMYGGKKLGNLGKKFDKDDKFRSILADPSSFLNQKAEGTENEHLKNLFYKMSELFTPSATRSADSTIYGKDPNDTTFFDNRTKSAITRVIPEFLSKIHAEVRGIRLGTEVGQLSYDYNSDKFIDRKVVKDKLFTTKMRKAIDESGGISKGAWTIDALEENDKNGLVQKHKAKILRSILTHSGSGKALYISSMTENGFFDQFGEDKEEMRRLFDNAEVLENARGYASGILRFKALIEEMMDNGHIEPLEDAGLIRYDSKEDEWIINDDMLLKGNIDHLVKQTLKEIAEPKEEIKERDFTQAAKETAEAQFEKVKKQSLAYAKQGKDKAKKGLKEAGAEAVKFYNDIREKGFKEAVNGRYESAKVKTTALSEKYYAKIEKQIEKLDITREGTEEKIDNLIVRVEKWTGKRPDITGKKMLDLLYELKDQAVAYKKEGVEVFIAKQKEVSEKGFASVVEEDFNKAKKRTEEVVNGLKKDVKALDLSKKGVEKRIDNMIEKANKAYERNPSKSLKVIVDTLYDLKASVKKNKEKISEESRGLIDDIHTLMSDTTVKKKDKASRSIATKIKGIFGMDKPNSPFDKDGDGDRDGNYRDRAKLFKTTREKAKPVDKQKERDETMFKSLGLLAGLMMLPLKFLSGVIGSGASGFLSGAVGHLGKMFGGMVKGGYKITRLALGPMISLFNPFAIAKGYRAIFKPLFDLLLDGLKRFLGKMFSRLFKDLLPRLFKRFLQKFSIRGLKDAIVNMLSKLRKKFGEFLKHLKQTKPYKNIVNRLSKLTKGFKEKVGKFVGHLGEFTKKLTKVYGEEGIKGVVKLLKNTTMELVTKSGVALKAAGVAMVTKLSDNFLRPLKDDIVNVTKAILPDKWVTKIDEMVTKIKGFTKSLSDKVVSVTDTAKTSITALYKKLSPEQYVTAIKSSGTSIVEGMKNTIMTAVKAVVPESIWEKSKNLFTKVSGWAVDKIDKGKKAVNKAWQYGKYAAGELVDDISTGASKAWQATKETVSSAWNASKAYASNVVQTVKNTTTYKKVSGMLGKIKEKVTPIIKWLVKKVFPAGIKLAGGAGKLSLRALSKIPIVSLAVGSYFAFECIKHNEWEGAAANILSSIIASFPGGLIPSLILDVYIIFNYKCGDEDKKEAELQKKLDAMTPEQRAEYEKQQLEQAKAGAGNLVDGSSSDKKEMTKEEKLADVERRRKEALVKLPKDATFRRNMTNVAFNTEVAKIKASYAVTESEAYKSTKAYVSEKANAISGYFAGDEHTTPIDPKTGKPVKKTATTTAETATKLASQKSSAEETPTTVKDADKKAIILKHQIKQFDAVLKRLKKEGRSAEVIAQVTKRRDELKAQLDALAVKKQELKKTEDHVKQVAAAAKQKDPAKASTMLTGLLDKAAGNGLGGQLVTQLKQTGILDKVDQAAKPFMDKLQKAGIDPSKGIDPRKILATYGVDPDGKIDPDKALAAVSKAVPEAAPMLKKLKDQSGTIKKQVDQLTDAAGKVGESLNNKGDVQGGIMSMLSSVQGIVATVLPNTPDGKKALADITGKIKTLSSKFGDPKSTFNSVLPNMGTAGTVTASPSSSENHAEINNPDVHYGGGDSNTTKTTDSNTTTSSKTNTTKNSDTNTSTSSDSNTTKKDTKKDGKAVKATAKDKKAAKEKVKKDTSPPKVETTETKKGKEDIKKRVEKVLAGLRGLNFFVYEEDKMLLNQIALHEVGKQGYNGEFGNGKYTNKHKPITTMTIKEVFALQRQLAKRTKGTKYQTSAVGRYQFMFNTLTELVKEAGVSLETKFTPLVQDKLILFRLYKKRHYGSWKLGKIDDKKFVHHLSMEFASIEDPYLGMGHYKGQRRARNKAKNFYTLFQEMRKIMGTSKKVNEDGTAAETSVDEKTGKPIGNDTKGTVKHGKTPNSLGGLGKAVGTILGSFSQGPLAVLKAAIGAFIQFLTGMTPEEGMDEETSDGSAPMGDLTKDDVDPNDGGMPVDTSTVGQDPDKVIHGSGGKTAISEIDLKNMKIVDIRKKYNTRKNDHGTQTVTGIVYHRTEGASISSSLHWVYKDPKAPKGIGAHFWIGRDGTIYLAHDPSVFVWHAGTSKCPRKKGKSRGNIGIEIAGKYQGGRWETLTEAQKKSIANLTVFLHKKYGNIHHFYHGDQNLWCKTKGEGYEAMKIGDAAVAGKDFGSGESPKTKVSSTTTASGSTSTTKTKMSTSAPASTTKSTTSTSDKKGGPTADDKETKKTDKTNEVDNKEAKSITTKQEKGSKGSTPSTSKSSEDHDLPSHKQKPVDPDKHDLGSSDIDEEDDEKKDKDVKATNGGSVGSDKEKKDDGKNTGATTSAKPREVQNHASINDPKPKTGGGDASSTTTPSTAVDDEEKKSNCPNENVALKMFNMVVNNTKDPKGDSTAAILSRGIEGKYKKAYVFLLRKTGKNINVGMEYPKSVEHLKSCSLKIITGIKFTIEKVVEMFDKHAPDSKNRNFFVKMVAVIEKLIASKSGKPATADSGTETATQSKERSTDTSTATTTTSNETADTPSDKTVAATDSTTQTDATANVSTGSGDATQQPKKNSMEGIPADKKAFLAALCKVESNCNYKLKPNSSGYEGKFQFRFRKGDDGLKFIRKMGITVQQWRNSEELQNKHMLLVLDQYDKELKSAGIPINNWTRWLRHNQGLGGAKAILSGKLTRTIRRNIRNQAVKGSTDAQLIANYTKKFKHRFMNGNSTDSGNMSTDTSGTSTSGTTSTPGTVDGNSTNIGGVVSDLLSIAASDKSTEAKIVAAAGVAAKALLSGVGTGGTGGGSSSGGSVSVADGGVANKGNANVSSSEVNGAKVQDVFDIDPSKMPQWEGLDPNFRIRVMKIGIYWKKKYGNKLKFTSGYRSNEYQAKLYEASKKRHGGKTSMVARPGHSMHNYGLAADLGALRNGANSPMSILDKEGVLAKYKCYRPMKSEDWHIEPVETKGHRGTKGGEVKVGAETGEADLGTSGSSGSSGGSGDSSTSGGSGGIGDTVSALGTSATGNSAVGGWLGAGFKMLESLFDKGKSGVTDGKAPEPGSKLNDLLNTKPTGADAKDYSKHFGTLASHQSLGNSHLEQINKHMDKLVKTNEQLAGHLAASQQQAQQPTTQVNPTHETTKSFSMDENVAVNLDRTHAVKTMN